MSLWNAIVDFIEPAWNWITDSSISDLPDELLYTQGMSGSSPIQTAIDYGTGFFGSDLGSLVKSGAKYYLESQEKGGPMGKASKMKVADIGSAPSSAAAALAAARNPVGLRNPDVQAAIRATAGRTNFNPQLNEISKQYLTKRQGQLTLGVGSPSLGRVTPTSAAPVRTAAKEVELG